MDKQTILGIADRCLNERLSTLRKRPASEDVRQVSLVTQEVLYGLYHEPRATGGMGDAEDILRNDNIKASLATLPSAVRQLAADVLVCAHARIKANGAA